MTDALHPIAYPIEDVPEIVGVPRTKVFQAVREQKLSARKVGRSTIITHDDLMAWINSWRSKASSPSRWRLK
jgi:excisionase family DNA binding protein